MQNPYLTLGVASNASTEQIRAAYHELVKRCHPDGVREEAARQAAQEALVQLNLAYEEAMKRATFRETNNVVIHDAKLMAKKLFEQGRIDSALRMLNKTPDRDADWFALHGSILLKKGEPEAAHACFRTAVRMEPENTGYRELALSAGVQMRKQKTLRGRMGGWAKGFVNRML